MFELRVDREIRGELMEGKFIESKTARKNGWGSDPYRSVTRLTADERRAIQDGHTVWFKFTPWHYAQSGYKIVTYRQGYGYDSREPTSGELARLVN